MIHATSLRLRVTVLLVVAVAISLSVANSVIDTRVDSEALQRFDDNLLDSAQALSELLTAQSSEVHADLPNDALPRFLASEGKVFFRMDCNGHVVASPSAFSLHWPANPSGEPTYTDINTSDGNLLRVVAIRLPMAPNADLYAMAPAQQSSVDSTRTMPVCVLKLAVDRGKLDRFLDSLDAILVGTIAFVTLLVLVLTPWLVARGLRPLDKLGDAMRDIGPQSPDRRLGEVNARELRPLVGRFNEVLSRMEEGFVRERRFASGVAHELRTPLAELRALVEVELRYPSERSLHALLEDVRSIGTEMERTVSALLLLTRIEGGLEKVQLEAIDVGALTHKLVERYADTARTRELRMDVMCMSSPPWSADSTLLDVLIGNLLRNALAYAPIGSSVSVRAEADSWLIENQAPDLMVAELDLMRQHFWRKGEDAGVHTGLGLALASAAAHAQGLRLDLSLSDHTLRASIMRDMVAHAL